MQAKNDVRLKIDINSQTEKSILIIKSVYNITGRFYYVSNFEKLSALILKMALAKNKIFFDLVLLKTISVYKLNDYSFN